MGSGNSVFNFKQFSVDHSNASMKVGTDAVLLGAWVNLSFKPDYVLDVGTGSGVIALMLAQRLEGRAHIDAVEIEEKDALQALTNVKKSRWPGTVHIHHTSIQAFAPSYKYDLIVSNPPFFSNSFAPPDTGRLHARHTNALSFEALIEAVMGLLKPMGKFNVILPAKEGIEFVRIASFKGLVCTRNVAFRSRRNHPVERLLLEFAFEPSPLEKGDIVHFEVGNDWTDEYKMLTREFYLKL